MSDFRDELEQNFRECTDDELLDKLRSDSLTELAQDVIRTELQSRGVSYIAPRADTVQVNEESLPQEAFEVVASFATTTEAHIMRGHLETEGIPAFIPDDYLGTGNAFLLTGAKSIRVMVPLSLLPRAAELVKDLHEGKFAIEDDAESSRPSDESQSNHLGTEEAFRAFAQDTHLIKAWQARFNQTGIWAGFNPFAMVLGVCWFFYRKMYVLGALVAIADIAVFIILGPIGLLVLVRLPLSLLANMFYYRRAKKAVSAVQSAGLPKTDAVQRLQSEGGISVPGFCAGIIVYGLASRIAGELYSFMHY